MCCECLIYLFRLLLFSTFISETYFGSMKETTTCQTEYLQYNYTFKYSHFYGVYTHVLLF